MTAESAPVLAVRFEGLHMTFSSGLKEAVWALRGMQLDVYEGQVLGLLGPNGCGKTTSLSCLMGLLEPKLGAVWMWGRRVSAMNPGAKTRQYGVLLEDTRLPPFLTVEQTLRTVCTTRRLEAAAQPKEIERVVHLCGIKDILTRKTGVLSKGQARKAGLAVALIGDPSLLLLDEPSAGLDVAARVEFDKLLRNLRDGKRTIIIASHLLSDVEAICSHVAIMYEGKVMLQDATESLLRQARQEGGSDVHVDVADTSKLDEMGMEHEPSRYPGLAVIRTELSVKELLSTLLACDIVPKRLEPRENLVSLYLDVTRKGSVS